MAGVARSRATAPTIAASQRAALRWAIWSACNGFSVPWLMGLVYCRRSFSRLCFGELGLKAIDGRAPREANGEISRTPAGGWDVSVALEAPLGSPVAEPDATVARVITISPCSR